MVYIHLPNRASFNEVETFVEQLKRVQILTNKKF